jgi:hypothetical protein
MKVIPILIGFIACWLIVNAMNNLSLFKEKKENAPIKSKVNVVNGNLEYQITLDNDSIYVYDNLRKVGSVAWGTNKLDSLLLKDNY